jgi:hypothetical protein
MGILIADTITLQTGLSLSNTVLSIKGQITNIQKQQQYDSTGVIIPDSSYYRVFYTTYLWANEAAYSSNPQLPVLQMNNNLFIDLSPSQITGDIYSLIYNSIKSNYQNATDI